MPQHVVVLHETNISLLPLPCSSSLPSFFFFVPVLVVLQLSSLLLIVPGSLAYPTEFKYMSTCLGTKVNKRIPDKPFQASTFEPISYFARENACLDKIREVPLVCDVVAHYFQFY